LSGTEPDAISCNLKTLQIPPLTGRFEGALNLSHNSIFNEQWAFPPKILTGVFALAFFRFRGKKVREPILDPSNSAAQTIVYCTGKLFWLCAAVNAYYASQRSSFKRTLRRISQPRADASTFFTFFHFFLILALPGRGMPKTEAPEPPFEPMFPMGSRPSLDQEGRQIPLSTPFKALPPIIW